MVFHWMYSVQLFVACDVRVGLGSFGGVETFRPGCGESKMDGALGVDNEEHN